MTVWLHERIDYVTKSNTWGHPRFVTLFPGRCSEEYLRQEIGDNLVDRALDLYVLTREGEQ